jgi:hypothetical protein
MNLHLLGALYLEEHYIKESEEHCIYQIVKSASSILNVKLNKNFENCNITKLVLLTSYICSFK